MYTVTRQGQFSIWQCRICPTASYSQEDADKHQENAHTMKPHVIPGYNTIAEVEAPVVEGELVESIDGKDVEDPGEDIGSGSMA